MLHTKEQDKIPEEQLCDVEIENLPKKELRVMIVKMIQKLRKRMDAQIEKFQEVFNNESLLSHIWLFLTPWTVVHQASLSMESSKNTGLGSQYSLLQGILLTQGWNPGLLFCRQILTIWATREAPNKKLENIKYTHTQQNRTHIQHDSKEIKPVHPKGNQP